MPRRKPSTPLSGRTTRSARRSSNWTSSSSRSARVTDRREVVDRRRTEPRVLRQVAEGVLVHQSEFLQTNAVVVRGTAGVLLVDPGLTGAEMACLADDLR